MIKLKTTVWSKVKSFRRLFFLFVLILIGWLGMTDIAKAWLMSYHNWFLGVLMVIGSPISFYVPVYENFYNEALDATKT